jgi:putative polyhydroxyalkanoate system protein
MSTIELKRDHALGMRKAMTAARRISVELQRDFGMTCEWQGHVLRFSRPGVNGELKVEKDHIELHARLGILLAAFKPRIVEKLERNFDAYFG